MHSLKKSKSIHMTSEIYEYDKDLKREYKGLWNFRGGRWRGQPLPVEEK